MRKTLFITILAVAFFAPSCVFETIRGNGNLTSETRNIPAAPRIKTQGPFDVAIIIGSTHSIKIEADANLIPYILTSTEDGRLVIHTKDHVNISSNNKIKVYITTDMVEEIDLNGSGNVTCDSKITGGDHLDLSIAGSGDMTLDVNSPKVKCSIAGSGNITLTGETKDSRIDIAGNGDYKAGGLQSENVDVHIAGSGSAHVFAASSLDVNIAGSGDIYYKGSPNIKQSIVGSGTIKQE